MQASVKNELTNFKLGTRVLKKNLFKNEDVL